MKAQVWPAENLQSVPQCPLCGAGRRQLLYDGLTDRVFDVAPGSWTLYKCEQCQVAWLDPRPDESSIGRAYETYFTHVADDDVSLKPRNGLIRRLHGWINGYQCARYGMVNTDISNIGRWIVPLLPPFRAKADAECRNLPRPSPGARRLLDVGFGNGGFLKLATRMGWDAVGIDFDEKAVQVAQKQGLNVRRGSVKDLLTEDTRYNAITISHVIEHVHQPRVLLQQVFSLLQPGGWLWLETPNIQSDGAHRFGRYWRGLEVPRHLVLFNSAALQSSLIKAGFEQIEQHWHGMVALSCHTASATLAAGGNASEAVPQLLPPLAAVLAELHGLLRPTRREFLTFTARKPT